MLPDPHKTLLNTIKELTLSHTTLISDSHIAKLGKLIAIGYVYDNEVLKKEYDSISADDFHPPDGIIRNVSKGISITLECKAGSKFENRFAKQLKFYSENESFKRVFIKDDEQNEILVVCYTENLEAIKKIVKKLRLSTRIVVWSVETDPYTPDILLSEKSGSPENKFFIKKECGNHIDDLLDEQLQEGIWTNPPSIDFPEQTISIQNLVALVAKRLMAHIFLDKELDAEDFIAKMTDVPVRNGKVFTAIDYALKCIPELGEFEKDGRTIKLKGRTKIEYIEKRIEQIENSNKEDFFVGLDAISGKRTRVSSRKRVKQERIDKWSSS